MTTISTTAQNQERIREYHNQQKKRINEAEKLLRQVLPQEERQLFDLLIANMLVDLCWNFYGYGPAVTPESMRQENANLQAKINKVKRKYQLA